MYIRVTDFGDSVRIQKKLMNLSGAIKDMSPVMRKIYLNMLQNNTAMFVSEGRRGGGSWKPLKQATIEGRVARGYKPGPILNMSGRLSDSVTSEWSPDHYKEITNHSVGIGTNVPYARAHQYGARGKNIPARPYLQILEADRVRWNRMIADYLMRAYGNRNV